MQAERASTASAASVRTKVTSLPAISRRRLGWSIDRTRLSTVAVASTISGTSTADRQCGSARGSAMPRPILRGWFWASGRYRSPAPPPMRITVLPGIWPPDVGGPATHAPELARFLIGRGHSVRVVTMASAPPTERPCPVVDGRQRTPVSDPLRRAHAARRRRRARHRRRLRLRDVRGGRNGDSRCPPPPRREARIRPGVRARTPLGSLRRDARGVSGGEWTAADDAEAGADLGAPAGGNPGRSE